MSEANGNNTLQSIHLHAPNVHLVSADMGYGHRRAVDALRPISRQEIIVAGKNDGSTTAEKLLWKRILSMYEFFSRTRSIPIIGKQIFGLLDTFLKIPSLYPIRNLSKSTFQVTMLEWAIKQGLCSGVLARLEQEHLPLITSFYAPAIAADNSGYDSIYCIICDADLNRVWVAKEPWESRINYCVPCGKAALRLKQYGVADERIFVTGFPLDESLLGDNLQILRHDLGQRLHYLDPTGRFRAMHEKSVEHFLGPDMYVPKKDRVLTISFAIGGAGAQRENARRIVRSLKKKLNKGEIALNLIAGVKPEVAEFFEQIRREFVPDAPHVNILYTESMEDYFSSFNQLMRTTDILWTKPSELSFYTGLGMPIIMSPIIGSQEKFNRKWLREIRAGIRQENPDYTDQWLFHLLQEGHLADAAWSGFLKARKLGVRKIKELLINGTITRSDSPLQR